MNTAHLEMTMRCRREWIVQPAIWCAALCFLASPRLGNRVANAGLWFARWEWRIGNGQWRRLPMHIEIQDNEDDDGLCVYAVTSP